MREQAKHEIIAIWIATLWWIVRNIFAHEKNPVSFVKWCIGSWLLWLLAFWIAPTLSDVQEIKFAIVYVTWLIAPRLVIMLDTYIPLLVKKRVWE